MVSSPGRPAGAGPRSSALNHTEQGLGWARGLLQPAQSPVLDQAAPGLSVGALDRLLLIGTGVHQGGQFVEGEDDVRAELMLNSDGHLRGEPVGRSVQVADESHPVVVDVGEFLFPVRHRGVGLGSVGSSISTLRKPAPRSMIWNPPLW